MKISQILVESAADRGATKFISDNHLIKCMVQDGEIIANANVTLSVDGHVEVPFALCHGVFSAEGNVTSLKNFPRMFSFNSYLICMDQELKDLTGGPAKFTGNYYNVRNNKISSWKGAPDKLPNGGMNISNNLLTDFVGAPKEFGKELRISGNKFTSLKDIHKHIHRINSSIWIGGNPIKSNILGLLLIEGLTSVAIDDSWVKGRYNTPLLKKDEVKYHNSQDLIDAVAIINKYVGPKNNKGKISVLEAQNELIEAGLEDFAEP